MDVPRRCFKAATSEPSGLACADRRNGFRIQTSIGIAANEGSKNNGPARRRVRAGPGTKYNLIPRVGLKRRYTPCT